MLSAAAGTGDKSHPRYLCRHTSHPSGSRVLRGFLRLVFVPLGAQTSRLLEELDTAEHRVGFLLASVARTPQRTGRDWLLAAPALGELRLPRVRLQ